MCVLQESDMPDEVNIDELIDLPSDEERVRRLQVTLAYVPFYLLTVTKMLGMFLIMMHFHLFHRRFYRSAAETQRYVLQPEKQVKPHLLNNGFLCSLLLFFPVYP